MKSFRCPIVLLATLAMVTAALPGRADEPALPVAINLWTATFPGYQNSSSSSPAVAPDGTIYLGTFHGNFLAYNPEGQLKWSFKAGWEIKSSPAIAEDGTVYFGSRDRHFYAVTPEGALKWKFATGAWVDSSPAIAADGTIYFGGWDNFFYALHPDGSLKWKKDIGAIVDSSPAIAADGTVYFGAHDKKCYALHPAGTVRWTFVTGGAIISSPAIGADGTVYVSSTDGQLYALNPDGTEHWRSHTGNPTEASPVLSNDGTIGIASYLGEVPVTGFYDAEGHRRWTCPASCPIEVSAVAVTDRFYVSMPWRNVQAVPPGKPQEEWHFWRAELKDNVSASLTVSPEGIVYACAGFQLYAFRPPGELCLPAKSAWPMFRANPRHTGRVGK